MNSWHNDLDDLLVLELKHRFDATIFWRSPKGSWQIICCGNHMSILYNIRLQFASSSAQHEPWPQQRLLTCDGESGQGQDRASLSFIKNFIFHQERTQFRYNSLLNVKRLSNILAELPFHLRDRSPIVLCDSCTFKHMNIKWEKWCSMSRGMV